MAQKCPGAFYFDDLCSPTIEIYSMPWLGNDCFALTLVNCIPASWGRYSARSGQPLPFLIAVIYSQRQHETDTRTVGLQSSDCAQRDRLAAPYQFYIPDIYTCSCPDQPGVLEHIFRSKRVRSARSLAVRTDIMACSRSCNPGMKRSCMRCPAEVM